MNIHILSIVVWFNDFPVVLKEAIQEAYELIINLSIVFLRILVCDSYIYCLSIYS